MPKKYLENSLIYIGEIGDFCVERETNDSSRALYYVSSIFESTITLFQLLHNQSDFLEFEIPEKSVVIDSRQQIKNLILDQSRFTFVAIISILEFTAKDISLKEGFPVKIFLNNEKPKEKNKRKYLKDIIRASASEDLRLISIEDEKEWKFFLDIRNTLVHNNGIPDEDLDYKVNGKSYFFDKGSSMKNPDIQSLFIFSKRVVELFYDWSQKHEELVNVKKDN